jgi:hypothetical protein
MAPSLLVFGRDWLVVSGRLDAGGDDDGEGTAGVPPLPAGRER